MKNENEIIDYKKLILSLWKEKFTILKFTLIFIIVGIFYSVNQKNIYTSSSTFYPHYEVMQDNSIRQIAGLTGINLSQKGTDVPPTLYPNIISSTPFKNKILNKKIILDNKELTFRKYLLENNKSSFLSSLISEFYKIPSKIFSFIINESNYEMKEKESINYIKVSDVDYNLYKNINQKIIIDVNEREKFIKISVTDVNPGVSAQIAKISEELLQESVINFKLKNIKSLYDFTNNQLIKSRNNLFKLQDSLANFRESNKNIGSNIFLNNLMRIESEVAVSQSVYNELSISKEKAEIDVKKNTPIFTILNPVTFPMEKSYPKRTQIVLFFGFFGFSLISIWVLLKDYLIKYINLLKN